MHVIKNSGYKNRVLASFFFFFLCFSPILEAAEERQENEWVVDKVTENTVYASVNGGVIHGDRLLLILSKGSCERAILATTIYSYIEPSIVSKLDGKEISAIFDGNTIEVRVVQTFPFLMGSRSIIEIMDVSVERFISSVPDEHTITLKYESTPFGSVSEFFDIDHNNWTMNGVGLTLQRAQQFCKNL